MKTLIAVLIGSSMALSFSAEATPCRDIGAAVVNQFVAVSRFKVETPEQIQGYNGLVAAQVQSCLDGKNMRMGGASSKDAGVAMALTVAQAVDKGTGNKISGLNAIAMTQTSFSYGYAFGE